MKDAKGHGSDSRGGVSGQVTAVKGLVNMIRPPAAHQEGIRQGVPMSDDERAQKGDYLPLDFWRRSFYRWARQAGAALLIGFVMLGSYSKNDRAFAARFPFEGFWINGTAEFGCPNVLAKGVTVFDQADDVISLIFRQSFIRRGCILEHPFSGSQGDLPGIIPFWGLDNEISGQRPRHFPDERGISNSISGGLPRIFSLILNSDYGVSDCHVFRLTGNIRPQLAFDSVGGLSGRFGGPFADLYSSPQENSLYADSNELQKSDGNRRNTKPYRICVECILGRTICGLLLGLGLSILGWKNLYDKRRLIGATLVCCGWLLGGLTLISIWWLL